MLAIDELRDEALTIRRDYAVSGVPGSPDLAMMASGLGLTFGPRRRFRPPVLGGLARGRLTLAVDLPEAEDCPRSRWWRAAVAYAGARLRLFGTQDACFICSEWMRPNGEADLAAMIFAGLLVGAGLPDEAIQGQPDALAATLRLPLVVVRPWRHYLSRALGEGPATSGSGGLHLCESSQAYQVG